MIKLHLIKYDGTEMDIECKHFEIRSNHATNWIHVFYQNGENEYIHDFCAIKLN